MRIPEELAPISYDLSKKVFEGKITFKEGQELLVGSNRMNSNSAADYINNFRNLMEGKKFTRTNNAFSMEYFVENIYKDYGKQSLSNALNALKLHFQYFESVSKAKTHKMRFIYEKYLALSLSETPENAFLDDIEQDEIITELVKQAKTKAEIVGEIKNLKPSDPEEVIINGKTFKRDNRTIAQLKFLRDFKCQICSTTIKKKDGSLYIEAAHIDPKHKKGRETPDNILILCPNHHKEFDFGDRTITKRNIAGIEFSLNENYYSISLTID